jgi:HD superfamily phosphodiesterase
MQAMNLKEAQAYIEQTSSMERYQKYAQYIKPEYFHRPHGIHGINHAKRVLFLVELLAALENLDEIERDILSVAAVYHDIGRVSDGVGTGHGYASISKAEQFSLIHMPNPEDYATVKYLIEVHCIHDREAFALVKEYGLQQPERAMGLLKFFKDADGLDRVRIHDLDPAMLRLPVSKQLVQVAAELFLYHK